MVGKSGGGGVDKPEERRGEGTKREDSRSIFDTCMNVRGKRPQSQRNLPSKIFFQCKTGIQTESAKLPVTAENLDYFTPKNLKLSALSFSCREDFERF